MSLIATINISSVYVRSRRRRNETKFCDFFFFVWAWANKNELMTFWRRRCWCCVIIVLLGEIKRFLMLFLQAKIEGRKVVCVFCTSKFLNLMETWDFPDDISVYYSFARSYEQFMTNFLSQLFSETNKNCKKYYRLLVDERNR